MPSVTRLTSYPAFRQAIDSGNPSIVFFTATWAGPARAIGPVFESLASRDGTGKVNYYVVDIDVVEDAAREANIRSVPTFIVFRDGQSSGSIIGANPPGLERLVNSAQNNY